VTNRLAIRFGALGLAALIYTPALAAQGSTYPTQPPAPMPLKPAALPPFQETTLANGVRVLLVENHRNPTVAYRLALPAGDIYDPTGKTGTATMMAGLLTKGAGSRSADEIAAAIEGTGGGMVAGTDEDYLSVSGFVLSNAAPIAFELLGDVIARPTFSDKEFELARTQTLSGLQLNAASPGFLAGKFFRAGLYGAHPYGATATATTVRAITRADLQAFHAARVRPRGALLVVAGDITMSQLTTLANKAFTGWTGAPAASSALPSPPARSKAEILLVHRPGSVQSNLLVGNLAIGPADSARFAAVLASQIIGGGSDGRLFTILREQKSWTYGAYSTLTRVRGIGRFEANAEVRTEVTDSALVEMLAQLKRIGAEPITATEFEGKRGAMVGSFPLTIETPQALAERVASITLYGLPANYLQTYRTKMAAVTTAQVSAAARRVIRPQQALIVVVGDGTKLYEKLAKIAPVTIRNADGDVMQPSDLTPKVMAAAFDISQLKASRDSFVVMVQGNPLGTSVVSVEAKNDGWTFSENTNVMNGMIVQRTTLDNDGTLAPRSLQQGGSTQGQQTKTEIAFAGGKAKGSAQTPSQTGPQTKAIETDLPTGTIAADALQVALPLFRWADKATFSLNVFSAGKGTVEPVTLKVVGSESVKVPAGTFDCWKIEQTGGEASVVFYVAKAEKRIVKIAPVGQPIELQLAK
jgi:zinc protease